MILLRTLLAMVSAMEKFFSYQKPISVVVTYPRSAQEFGNNLSVMLVTACGRLRDCHYIPSADILQEVDNGVSFSTTPGVIVHSTTTRAHVNQNLGYIFGYINPHPPRSLLVPDRIAKLNPDSNAVLYWFDIGPGEPSISNDRCGQPIYPMLD